MTRSSRILVLATLAGGSTALAPPIEVAPSIGPAADDPPGAAVVLVIVRTGEGQSIEPILADYGAALLKAVSSRNIYLLSMPDTEFLGADVEAMQGDARIEDAQADGGATSPEAVDGDTQPFFFYVPSDDLEGQYPDPLMGLGPAQQLADGAETVVAVLDTGVDADHELLAGRVIAGGYDFTDGDADPDDSGNGFDDNGDGVVDALVGHGTFIAGIIAAVAPEAMILPVRVLGDEGTADAFTVVQGVYHAIDAGADVICLSLGTKTHNRILRDAVDEAYETGIVVVAAAGNEDHEHPVQMPAGQDSVIGVGSTDAGDVKSDFSNYGDAVRLCAPGTGIVSAAAGGGYVQASGTSASAAFVAAAAALVKSTNLDSTPAEIEATLAATAFDLDDLNPDYAGLLGAGRLEVAQALGLQDADLDLSGSVGVDDMLALLAAWGQTGSPADLDGSGLVEIQDLLILLASWV